MVYVVTEWYNESVTFMLRHQIPLYNRSLIAYIVHYYSPSRVYVEVTRVILVDHALWLVEEFFVRWLASSRMSAKKSTALLSFSTQPSVLEMTSFRTFRI